MLADRVFGASREVIVEFAERHKLPTAFQLRDYVDAGGLLSYGPSEQDFYIPVQQPSLFQMVINAKTAKALGVTIPQSLLLRADQVIEWGPGICAQIVPNSGAL